MRFILDDQRWRVQFVGENQVNVNHMDDHKVNRNVQSPVLLSKFEHGPNNIEQASVCSEDQVNSLAIRHSEVLIHNVKEINNHKHNPVYPHSVEPFQSKV